MAIAIFPHGHRLSAQRPARHPSASFTAHCARTITPSDRLGPPPRARLHAQSRLARRLANLCIYVTGIALSASVGPLIYAIGSRDGAISWAADIVDLLNHL
jgi:hypothetical protein